MSEISSIWIDEAGDLKPEHVRAVLRHTRRWTRLQERAARKQRAKGFGWANWYISRGRLPLNPSRSELRRVSWRRAH